MVLHNFFFFIFAFLQKIYELFQITWLTDRWNSPEYFNILFYNIYNNLYTPAQNIYSFMQNFNYIQGFFFKWIHLFPYFSIFLYFSFNIVDREIFQWNMVKWQNIWVCCPIELSFFYYFIFFLYSSSHNSYIPRDI